MKIIYPDYKKCITSLANSILQAFGADTEGRGTLRMCDALLKKEYKNVVVLLLDGMGTAVMEGNLEKQGFFFRHLQDSYHSVFPPTTVAATTSICSGLNPCEHSWLGWDCYYKEIDKNVTVFRNTEMETGLSVAEFHVAWQYCPYESVVQKIQRAGGNAYVASPFAEPYPQDFEGICQQIEKLCKLEGKKYIYGYWNEPDSTMHRTGCYSEATKAVFKELEARVQQLCERLSDTLVIVTADHGHRDSAGVAIEDYPDILECLVRKPSIEPRALNLFVKEGMAQQLEEGFQKHFGDKFLLFTKEEVKEKQLFGTGEAHPRFDEMLGDYLAVAVSDLSIYNSKEEAERFIGVHAGLTEAEVLIPLIAVEIP